MKLYFLWLLGFIMYCTGLECWKCIGEWCRDNPVGDYRVSKTSCQPRESCMKVYYRMYDNTSRLYESVTRSCSMGKCVSLGIDQFTDCMANPRIYQIDGCSLRSCCDNEDLCNSTAKHLTNQSVILLNTILTVLFIRFR
ncbi:hypothetical protein SNE40_014929 [Patella caerulea]|uniref:Uncharacterized protein n=1 Tax=Patella caerulea TaxID=87958 RepID=A0AAN8JJ31_PATCE